MSRRAPEKPIREIGYYWVTMNRPPEAPANAYSDAHAALVLRWEGRSWGHPMSDTGYGESYDDHEIVVLSERLEPPKFHWAFTAPQLVRDDT